MKSLYPILIILFLLKDSFNNIYPVLQLLSESYEVKLFSVDSLPFIRDITRFLRLHRKENW